jgi:hypothetical protein
MSEQVFADGIGPIVVVGGTVRLDFITLVPDEGDASARPKSVVQHRLFMPMEAFLIAARRFSEAAEAIAKMSTAATPAVPAPPPATPVSLAAMPSPPPPAEAPIEPPDEPAAPAERPKPPFP